MRARIFRPSKSSMSSGTGRTRLWVLEFTPTHQREIDPLMGWTSSDETQTQIRMKFDSQEAALEYARNHGFEAVISEPHSRKLNIRPGGYGDNFATNRRTVWTH